MASYFRDFYKSETILASEEKTLFRERWIGFPGEAFMLGVGIQDVNLWAGAEFQVLINGVPQLDYGRIEDRIGSIDLMTPIHIYLPENCLIEMVAKNGSASDSIFMGRLQCHTI